jgi:hypothetical protein
VNGQEQAAHRTVTQNLKAECDLLWSAISDLESVLQARCDGLDERVRLQRQTFDLAFLELHDLRDALSHAVDQLQREITTRAIDTTPLKRPFLGRVLWFLRGE